ncbi:AsmA family protein [Methylovorus sp. SPW-M1]
MNKLLKFGLIGLAAVVVVLLVVVGIVAATFNPNDYKQTVINLVKEKKQRTLHLDGDIKLAFWPSIGADLGRISISEHNSDKEFAAVDGLKVSLALLPLLKKQLVVDTVYVDGVRANIVRYKDGTTNFDDLMSKDEEESEQIKFDIDGINVTNAALNVRDEMTDKQLALRKFNLKTGHVALGTPFDLASDFELEANNPAVKARVSIKGNVLADPEQQHFAVKGLDAGIKGDIATLKDADLTLSGDVDARLEHMELLVDSLKLALAATQDGAKLKVALDAPQIRVQQDTVSGKQASINLSQEKGSDTLTAKLVLADLKGSPKAVQSSGISGEVNVKQGEHQLQSTFNSPFTGNLETQVFDLPKLVGKINVNDPALPKREMQGDFAFKLHADAKQQLVNSDFTLNLDATRLKGDVAVSKFDQPDIRFNLIGDALDLNALLGSPASKASTKPVAVDKSSPAKPADLSALANLRLQGNVQMGRIVYDKYQLSNLKLGVKADGQTLDIKPLSVKLDDSQIAGSLGISRFANPIYRFDIDIDKLDADKYITKSDAPPAKPGDAAKKPQTDAPIDLSALKQFNANGELRIGWLKVANIKSTNVRLKLKAEDGVAELAPLSANLYEGSVNGSLKVDARTTPSITVRQDMKGIAIGPLLTDAINNDMLSGKGTLNLDITTQGGTVSALKKALNGKAALNLADGAVKGIDVAGTLRGVKDKLNVLKGQSSVTGDKSKKTDFSEMSASFTIKNGVAHNEDLSMKAPLFRITGSGDIDIANETLDYVAKPTVVNTLKGQGGADLSEMNGLTIPIKLSGTFAQPAYAIDFAGLGAAIAKNKLLEGVGGTKGEAVKNLMGGNKEEALKSLLGGKKDATTAPADGQPSNTDATPKETPEEKAKKKLNKLLGF